MAWNIPGPTGPHPVACTDILTKPGEDGALFRLMYPTEKFEPSVDVCPLWWEAPEYMQSFASFVTFPKLKFLVNMAMGDIRVPVRRDGPLVMPEGGAPLPVVILSHGLGGTRFFDSFFAFDLASHGFLVACIEHRDRSTMSTFFYEETGNTEGEKYNKKWLEFTPMPKVVEERKILRNSQVHQRAKELSELMDHIEKLNEGTLTNIFSEFDLAPFKNQIDVSQCALTGHSFGGASIIIALGQDERFKVGVGMDPWMMPLDDDVFRVKLEKPYLFINSDSYQNHGDISGMYMMDQDVTGTTAERKTMTLIGTCHLTFCDFTFFFRRAWVAKLMRMRGPTEPKVANEVNTKLTLAFIRKYLDLPGEKDIDAVLAENPTLVFSGASFEIDEAEIKKMKDKIRAGKDGAQKSEDAAEQMTEEQKSDAKQEDQQEESQAVGGQDVESKDQQVEDESKDEQDAQQVQE